MTYLFAAFMVCWIGIFLYILYWQRQVHDLRAELDSLKAAQHEVTSGAAPAE